MRIIIFYYLISCLTLSAQNNVLCPVEDFKLVFHDEFTSETLNTDYWRTWTPYCSDGAPSCVVARAGNSLASSFQDHRVIMKPSEGLVHLQAAYSPNTWFGDFKTHESGLLYSKYPYEFAEGKFEIRCKLPAGTNLFGAFWLFGSNNEIDVFESCGTELYKLRNALHKWNETVRVCMNEESFPLQYLNVTDMATEFHTYSVIWDFGQVHYFFDGIPIHSFYRYYFLAGSIKVPVTTCSLPNGIQIYENCEFPISGGKQNVLAELKVAANGEFPCYTPSIIGDGPYWTEKELEIDYIRVHQRTPQSGFSDLCAGQLSEISGPINGMCVGEQYEFEMSAGPVGDVIWSTSSGLTIITQSSRSVIVEVDQTATGYETISAVDQDPPCPNAPSTYTHSVHIGAPQVSAIPFVDPCENTVTLLNDHVNENTTYSYFINGSILLNTWNNGNPIPYDPSQGWIEYYSASDDFCFDFEIRATNACGTTSAFSSAEDDCVFGPCDIWEPSGPNELSNLINLYPNPTIDEFIVNIDESVKLSIIKNLSVLDAQMSKRFALDNPNNHEITVNCSSWPSGIYYVSFFLEGQQHFSKIELK